MRLKLTLEYDGARFRGWAAQPSLRTVEGVVQDALGWVYESCDRLAVAGRTDTGVHALGQVASVDEEGGSTAARCSSTRSRRTASCAIWCEPSSGRCWRNPRRSWPACSKAPRVTQPARPCPRTASTSSASSTDFSDASLAGSDPDRVAS